MVLEACASWMFEEFGCATSGRVPMIVPPNQKLEILEGAGCTVLRRATATIVDGRIQVTNSTARSVPFACRYISGEFAPLCFPAPTYIPPNTSTAAISLTYPSVQWASRNRN